VAVADRLKRIVDLLAGMGLLLHDDPPKVIQLEGRAWGPPAGGLALSIRCRPPILSVVLRNVSSAPISLTIPGWLFFYEVHISAPLSPYGQALLKPEHRTEKISVTLKPGEATETEIPLQLLFVNPQGHRVNVTCTLSGGTRLESNEVTIPTGRS
jgi:hypothetical protein